MIAALGLSILFSLVVGIIAARNRRAEAIIVPTLDVFQSIPILGFFPVVILGIIAVVPGAVGVNFAVIVLIFTSMSWNITFGVYEAVKSIPQDYIDLSSIANTSTWQRVTSLYIPASLSRIAYNTQTSWAVGLFYLVASEILTLGGKTERVGHGIGVAIIMFVSEQPPDYTAYVYALSALVAAVIVWQFVFLREFALWADRYKFVEEPRAVKKDPLMKFYSWVNRRGISKLFLLTQERGVTRFTSSLTRFRRGIIYSMILIISIFFVLEVGAFFSSGAANHLTTLPSLSAILATEGVVLGNLAVSFLRIWYVYFICVGISLPLGITIALSESLYDTITPLLETVASVPAPILLPVIVAFALHSGEAVAAIIIFLGMVWYIIFNIMGSIRSLPKELWELRREFHVSVLSAWRNIYIPGTLPAFVTGSITAVGAAWNTLIVAEYYSTVTPTGNTIVLTQVGAGIGKLIVTYTNDGNLLGLTLAILTMSALVVAFNLTVWRRVYHYVTKRYTYNR